MDNTKNTFGIIFLIIILLVFSVGGYFFMNYMVNHEDEKKADSNQVTEDEELRIDTGKDYLYFTNGEEYLESEEIEKADVVFNFKGLESLNETLHEELEKLYDATVVKIDDVNIPEDAQIRENDLGYYSFSYREYNNTEFGTYVSLVVLDYDYDVINGAIIKNVKSYVVDKKTGKIYSNQELLDKFDVTEDDIIESVTTRLNNTQVLDGDEQVIDITGTIDSIRKSDYESGVKALSISKNGKLAINFIVKSNKINYNDSIELN